MFNVEDVTEATKLIPNKGGRKAKYPLREMKVGQTFFVPCPTKDAARVRVSILNSSNAILGVGYISTQVRTENGVEGVRVWRIK